MKIVAQRVCSRLYVDLADKCRTVHAYPNSRLTRRLGRKTRNARSNGLFQLTARIFKRTRNRLSISSFRIKLSLCRRIGIRQARHHLTHAGDILPNVARCIYDTPIFRAQNDVGMPAHDFHNQCARHGIAQFAQVADIDFQNAVTCNAPHRQHAAAAQVFTKQHTQHRRLHRPRFGMLTQMPPRRVGRRTEHKAMVGSLRTNHQVNFILFRLYNAIHTSIAKDCI